jgi:hypothetical protein
VRVRAAVAAGLGATALAAGVADARSEIGGPPTLDLKRCDRFVGPCSDPIVLGKAKHAVARVEIVGFQSRIGLCVEIDTIPFGGSGSCPAGGVPSDGSAVSIYGYSVSFGHKPFTQLVGQVRTDVARVRVTYRRNGELKRRRAGVAQVDGELLEAIREEEPFGVVEATLQGCVANKRLRFTAFDEEGDVLETARSRRFPNACNRTPRGLTAGVGASGRLTPCRAQTANSVIRWSPAGARCLVAGRSESLGD